MKRIQIKSEKMFQRTLTTGICCVAQNGARHVINAAYICENDDGNTCFMVDTIQGLLSFDEQITVFVFDSPREAQQFLTFERCEFDEDKILNAEIIEL